MKKAIVKVFALVFVLSLVLSFSLSLAVYADGEGDADSDIVSDNEDKKDKKDEKSEKDEKAEKSKFEPIAFVKNLKYMGIGMLGIFIVIGIIIICISLLNKIFSRAPKSEQ